MPSSHPALSKADGLAANSSDVMILIGRILIGWLFLAIGVPHLTNPAGFVGYLTNLGVPAPGFFAVVAALAEVTIGITLILGLATRYGALLCALFLLFATFIGHRYWEYPAAQQLAQYNNFLKNLAILGGALVLFVAGAGRFSIDAMLSKK